MFTKIKAMFDLKNKLRHFSVDRNENKKEGFELAAFGATDKGLEHGANEDSFLLLPLNENASASSAIDLECLMAVADGAGQDERGRIASQMAIDILRSSVFLPSVETPLERLVSGLENANKEIFDKSEQDFSLKGMTTTVTALYVKEEMVHIAHLGNSRAYLIRNARMQRVTKDQTLAEVLKEVNKEEDFKINKSAYKVLLQAAGDKPKAEIWQASFELEPDDILLVCSDGLTSELTDAEIIRIAESNAAQPRIAVKQLIDKANEMGGEDNITAIVAQFRSIPDKKIPFPGESSAYA